MSISVFWEELEKLESAVAPIHDHRGYDSRDFSLIEKQLDELLEDLTDFARKVGDGPLISKLTALTPNHDMGISLGMPERSQLEARILRIQRVLRTFGHDLLLEASSKIEPTSSRVIAAQVKEQPLTKKIFVVHGHDESILHQVVRLLGQLGLEPIILREQPNQGKTIIEKFEANSDVGFAVVLMTKDDLGASLKDAESNNYRPRARQNVVLELGYFIAKLSRARTCVLKEQGIEEPSDIFGVVYTEIDPSGAWRTILAKELRAAGHSVDMNRL